MDKYKKLVKDKVIEIRPYNNEKWSRYSFKNSRYILSPKDPLNLVIEETLKDDDKDPRKFCRGSSKKDNKEDKEDTDSEDEENSDKIDLTETKDDNEESKLRNNETTDETTTQNNQSNDNVNTENND